MRLEFLGTPFDNVDMEDALRFVDEFIQIGIPRHVLVTNANKFWLMRHDPGLTAIANRADLILTERALAVCCRILGKPLKGDVAGVALAKALLPYCQNRGYSIYFLGATPQVQQTLLYRVGREFPKLKIAGSHHGYFLDDKNEFVLQDILNKKPDVLLVALGSPAQEYWIRESIDSGKLNVPVSLGVGGSFDVIAGLKKDAPQWIRNSGLEWLFRFVQQPKRLWKRYAQTVPFLMSMVLVEGILGFNRAPSTDTSTFGDER
jgi:N-acetylglucosaminyldiphosphoundecaprenol N-acetyl-beta-D-mannosaminyltransferase